MKILNLYAGIGGNRKLWGDEHEITAVEIDLDIASVYMDYFPKDKMCVGDAHEYLLRHYMDFDFIWSSPPCPSHSRLNTFAVPQFYKEGSGGRELEYPDMKLYEEILLLKHWFKGKYCVENVIPYYTPLIPAVELDRHLFWANFNIGSLNIINKKISHKKADAKYLQEFFGYDLKGYNLKGKKRQILRNCVLPETGQYILDCAMDYIRKTDLTQTTLEL